MKLYDLGHVPWIQSQLIYHAMPRLGMEGIPAEKLATFSRSQYARGGLPDRAINTLKADHSPRLARWIVIQRERL
jgi:hypothetical protein